MVIDHYVFGMEPNTEIAVLRNGGVIWSGETSPDGNAVFTSSGGGNFVIVPVPTTPRGGGGKDPLPQQGDGSQSVALDLSREDVFDVAGRKVTGPLPTGIYFRRVKGAVKRFLVLR